MAAPILRIFSDLHFGDAASSVERLDYLLPLFDGADEIILNGDTLDTQIAEGPALVAETREFFGALSPPVTFISGNHDPDFSPLGELSLREGRIWLTHGNALFENVAPWGWARREIERRLAPLLAQVPPNERGLIETRLRLHRIACSGLPERHHPHHRHPIRKLHRLFDAVFPPDRLLAMFRVWRTTPQLADDLAAAQRPAARVVIMGHTHFPGVWHRPSGRVIINTGSFGPPWPTQFVELQGNMIRVFRVERETGRFRIGRRVAEFPLADTPPAP